MPWASIRGWQTRGSPPDRCQNVVLRTLLPIGPMGADHRRPVFAADPAVVVLTAPRITRVPQLEHPQPPGFHGIAAIVDLVQVDRVPYEDLTDEDPQCGWASTEQGLTPGRSAFDAADAPIGASSPQKGLMLEYLLLPEFRGRCIGPRFSDTLSDQSGVRIIGAYSLRDPWPASTPAFLTA